jgi:hypothetical protein
MNSSDVLSPYDSNKLFVSDESSNNSIEAGNSNSSNNSNMCKYNAPKKVASKPAITTKKKQILKKNVRVIFS